MARPRRQAAPAREPGLPHRPAKAFGTVTPVLRWHRGSAKRYRFDHAEHPVSGNVAEFHRGKAGSRSIPIRMPNTCPVTGLVALTGFVNIPARSNPSRTGHGRGGWITDFRVLITVRSAHKLGRMEPVWRLFRHECVRIRGSRTPFWPVTRGREQKSWPAAAYPLGRRPRGQQGRVSRIRAHLGRIAIPHIRYRA